MKRVVVTGGTGFVGANLVRRLIGTGHRPDLLVRPGFTSWRIDAIRDDVTIHEVNLGDRTSLTATLDQVRPTWIFHLATHGAYSWETDPAEMIRTNVVGTANLLAAGLTAGVEVFVNSGSSLEYGRQDHAPAETEPGCPDTPYGITKAAATALCVNASRSCPARIRTLRLYSAYGPFEDPRRFVPSLIVHGGRGVFPPLVDHRIARDYVFVEDVVDAYLRAAEDTSAEAGAIYNVGTGVQTTVGEAVEIARRVLGIAGRPTWGTMPPRAWDTHSWIADVRKARVVLGWTANRSFEDGFTRTVAWLTGDRALRERYEAAWPRAADGQ